MLAGAREDHRTLVPALDHARGQREGKTIEMIEVDEAGPVDHACVEEHGDGVDEARAADTLGGRLSDGVEGEVAAVEAHAVDGPEGRTHAVADLRALQGGAGGRRAGPEVLA